VPTSHGNGDPAGANHHFGATAKEVAEHASTLTRLELELAALELKRKAISLGVGAGLAAAAVILGLLGLAFAFATAAAALATVMAVWLALLIVTGVLVMLTGILGTVALGRFRSATPPLPEHAIREAKLTADAIRR
jgi:hypothetical protein